VYGVYAPRELAMLEGQTDAATISELARDYVTIIRRKQPHGPYRIGGMSFGGIVAYEVAKQLEAAGEEIAGLALVDAMLPEAARTKLRRFSALPLSAQLSVIAGRLNGRLRGKSESTPSVHVDDAQLRALDAQRQSSYHRAAAQYRPHMRPFYGPVTLIVAGARLSRDAMQDARCGFGALVPNLVVHRVEADHLALLEAPRVGEVAAALSLGLAPSRTAI
jgi:thioesterase domain-containing protein